MCFSRSDFVIFGHVKVFLSTNVWVLFKVPIFCLAQVSSCYMSCSSPPLMNTHWMIVTIFTVRSANKQTAFGFSDIKPVFLHFIPLLILMQFCSNGFWTCLISGISCEDFCKCSFTVLLQRCFSRERCIPDYLWVTSHLIN